MTTALVPVDHVAELALPEGPDVDRLAAGWLLGHRSPHTRAAYGRDLSAWSTWLGGSGVALLAAERAHVAAYSRWLEEAQERRPASVARAVAAISSFYGYLTDEGVIDRNPAARVKRPRVSDVSQTLGLDRAEAVALLTAAEEAGPRDLLVVSLLTLNGLRVSEVVALDVDAFVTERSHRVVKVRGKGGREDLVPLPTAVTDALDAVIDGRDRGPLLVDAVGNRLDRHDVTRIVARLARRAGITKRITPHSLRHTAVTMALDAGAPLRDVQDFARHADPRTTRRYDQARGVLDRHASYTVAGWLAR